MKRFTFTAALAATIIIGVGTTYAQSIEDARVSSKFLAGAKGCPKSICPTPTEADRLNNQYASAKRNCSVLLVFGQKHKDDCLALVEKAGYRFKSNSTEIDPDEDFSEASVSETFFTEAMACPGNVCKTHAEVETLSTRCPKALRNCKTAWALDDPTKGERCIKAVNAIGCSFKSNSTEIDMYEDFSQASVVWEYLNNETCDEDNVCKTQADATAMARLCKDAARQCQTAWALDYPAKGERCYKIVNTFDCKFTVADSKTATAATKPKTTDEKWVNLCNNYDCGEYGVCRVDKNKPFCLCNGESMMTGEHCELQRVSSASKKK
jgi:hypothetical protein